MVRQQDQDRPDHPTFVRGELDYRKTLPLHNRNSWTITRGTNQLRVKAIIFGAQLLPVMILFDVDGMMRF